jgi:hypothetical protein
MGKEKLQSKKKKKTEEEPINTRDFMKTVHMMLELLGRDMQSANPSRDVDFLVATRDGLFRVEISGQLFGYVRDFRELLVKHFPEAAAIEFNRERHIALAKATAKLSIQAPAGKEQIREFFKEFGVDPENMQMMIFAITQFMEMVRKLPMKFFSDPDNRFQTVETMQLELDELIILEEAQEEELVEEDYATE